MRVLLFANNWVGWQVANSLVAAGEEIVGIVLHPEQRRKFGPELLGVAASCGARLLDAARLKDDAVLNTIREWGPDIGVSAFFGYLLRQEVLDVFARGCVNLHPALLPYNRGAHPNVWSIVEETPAGVTLHYVDEGLDTGDVIAQREVETEPVDTGETLYRKLELACIQLFEATWPLLKNGTAPRRPQNQQSHTCHRVSDLGKLDRINLDGTYTARQLINILRARAFPPYDGPYFVENDKKVHIRIELKYESEP